MAPRAVVFLPFLVALAVAKSLNDFVPACGMPCLSDTISASTTCATDDNACLCEMMYTLKRNSEYCLRSKCDGAQYGQAMTGLDSFCRDGGSGTSPSSPAPTSQSPAPTGYPTGLPTTESTTVVPPPSASDETSVYPTVVPTTTSTTAPTTAPSGSVSSSDTTSIDTPTVTYGTASTSIDTPVPTFVSGTSTGSSPPSVTTTLASVGTTSQQTSATATQTKPQPPSSASSSTPSLNPTAAGVQQRAGYATVAGGLLVAALFSL